MSQPVKTQTNSENAPKATNWVSAACYLVSKVTDSGLLAVFLFVAPATVVAWRMGEKGLSEFMLKTVNQTWFAVLGWVLMLLTVLVSVKLFTWRDSTHRREVDRITQLKDETFREIREMKKQMNLFEGKEK